LSGWVRKRAETGKVKRDFAKESLALKYYRHLNENYKLAQGEGALLHRGTESAGRGNRKALYIEEKMDTEERIN